MGAAAKPRAIMPITANATGPGTVMSAAPTLTLTTAPLRTRFRTDSLGNRAETIRPTNIIAQ